MHFIKGQPIYCRIQVPYRNYDVTPLCSAYEVVQLLIKSVFNCTWPGICQGVRSDDKRFASIKAMAVYFTQTSKSHCTQPLSTRIKSSGTASALSLRATNVSNTRSHSLGGSQKDADETRWQSDNRLRVLNVSFLDTTHRWLSCLAQLLNSPVDLRALAFTH